MVNLIAVFSFETLLKEANLILLLAALLIIGGKLLGWFQEGSLKMVALGIVVGALVYSSIKNQNLLSDIGGAISSMANSAK